MSYYRPIVESRLEPVGKMGDNIVYRCPFCETDNDSGHLYVNYEKNVYNCFKCTCGGRNIASLIKLLGLSIDYDYESITSNYKKELDEALLSITESKKKEVKDYSKNLLTVTKYFNLHTKPLSDVAYTYLVSRNISHSMIERLGIKEGINLYGQTLEINGKSYAGKDYSERVMVPSLYKDGLISFYVGRDYTGTKYNKYVNPPSEVAYASEDVWNLENIESKHIIICEGVFSAIAAGGEKLNACATYGKSIAQKSNSDLKIHITSQAEKLLNKKFDTYYVFYDKDAHSEAYETARYLYDRGANVKIVTIPYEHYGLKADAADMTREEIFNCLASAKDYDPFSEIFI